ncbi:hypothetical protein UP10_16525 [Bradyrhizobium sp. LTSPM299]|uniref:hypothetical protein n=1 Tax=Bradyrhizobium sp. LTSPM299 TaxID=1619233 RepID=UPI0005C807DC|nr:hypothetical protein [Bradyrhizobium sp. LTSPM299]KJC59748.1 hypothetical protein UP10_16525 [Bradyrhizobium sp. LTSPM299]
MKKILLGLIAVVVVAVGGFFGFNFYVQHRVEGEVEAAFAQIRATGAKASHGKVSFDLRSRTVTIADIANESATQPPVSIKIANFTAAGVREGDATRFSADSIEATDVEIGAAVPGQTIAGLTYRLPRVAVKDYSGPAGPRQLPASASLFDLYRFGFEQLASISAASVSVPEVKGTISFGPQMHSDGGEFAYSGLALENLKDGKIASIKTDRFTFTVNSQPAGKPIKMTGNLANLVASDVDVGAMAAIFDPGKANDDREYRAYRHISAGPYVITSTQGLNMRIDGITIDDVAFKPSRLQLPALMAAIPPAGAAPPTPAQVREMMEKMATLYAGIRIGNTELHGLSVDTPEGPVKLQAMRFNIDNGKIGEMVFEGLDARAPKGPIKLGRFALKSLDISGLMRMGAEFSAQKPSAAQAFALLPLIQGVEVKGLVAPYKSTSKPINIDTINLSWGRFVGPIPSEAHVTAKLTSPIDRTDVGLQPLAAAGMDTIALDFELGAAWTEASHSFALEPVSLELGNLLKAQARISLANVPRAVFSSDMAQAATAAGQIEAGALEVTLRDLGCVELGIAQFAGVQNISRDDARRAIRDAIKAQGEAIGAANPDANALLAAVTSFVETPGQTLVIKLTPLGKVPAAQLMQLLKTDPLVALAQFRIEASTGL